RRAATSRPPFRPGCASMPTRIASSATWRVRQSSSTMPILLVVDDETPILHAFTRVFRPPEVQLLTATTAAEGLALVAQHRPDTVILDINLPDYSGLSAFGKLRQISTRGAGLL